MALAPGSRLGVYTITTQIGAGGMGEVYRARDTKLNRDVAVKVLPASVANDPERLARFNREAQVLAALNHPNIAHIHGFEDSTGVPALIMELVEGPTLADRIAKGPIPIDEALPIAKQIAEALEAAHEQGIIHRDLKPANIKLTESGMVKVLDFGLAKVEDRTGHDQSRLSIVTILKTEQGRLLGTTAYMSPEQARGQTVDTRTDIWAFGCVLYEMLTGRLAFPGATIPDHIAAILKNDPDWSALPASIPPAVRHLLRQCLEKDRKHRLADMADARTALAESLGAMHVSGTARARRPGIVSLAAGLLLAVAALGYLTWRQRDAAVAPPVLRNPVQVAATVSIEMQPSWSPDGSTVAYQSDQAGNNDIWIARVGGGAVNRTADSPVGDEVPRWSPDGKEIAFWSARDGGGFFIMPALSGGARKVAPARPDDAAAVAWSPNGAELAYPIVADGRTWVERLDVRSGATRRLAIPAEAREGCLELTWSPDGAFLAYVGAINYNNQTTRLWTLRLSDGKAARIADNRMNEWSLNWSRDSRALFFTSNRGGPMDLWRQQITDTGEALGEAVRITTGLDVLNAAFTPDGKRVAYAKGRKVANVWRVPLEGDRVVTWTEAQQVTFDQAHIESFDLSPDGHRLAVQSDRSGNPDVWLVPSEGGEMQQLTTEPTPDWWPAWSPDGREIAFYGFGHRSTTRQIWVLPAVGGPARALATGAFPRWSRDGKSVFFFAGTIWVVPAEGGTPRRFPLDDPSGVGARPVSTQFFTLSPDGRSFAFAAGASNDRRIWRAPLAGGTPRPVTSGQGDAPIWSPDGTGIYFTSIRDGGGASFERERTGINVWRVSVDDGKPERRVTNLAGRRGFLGPNIATDGRWLYFTWREDVADIWMMDVVYP